MADNQPANATPSDEYERFIAQLIENLRRSGRDVRALGFGRQNLVAGASSQKHQVDVSFIDLSFPQATIVLVECKRLARPVGLAHIKALKATLDDVTACPENPSSGLGLICSTAGAQSGASRFAEHYGIRIEKVAHGPDYGFRYENIVQVGLSSTVALSDSVSAVLFRKCKGCGRSFVVATNEQLCPACNADEQPSA